MKDNSMNEKKEVEQLRAQLASLKELLEVYEETVREKSDHLEQAIEESLNANKALETKTGELEEAYKKLSELEQMKTNFISTVTHELRTPLTSVLGFASNAYWIYRNDVLPVLPTDNRKLNRWAKAIEENLSIIVSEGKRLTHLINDVLDIAKMEAGKIEWNIQDVNIIDICRQALSVASGYPKSSQVEVVFEAPDTVLPVRGDPDRLVQVITNLMSNALKFTEQGKVTLKVERGSEHVKVSVNDTGKGIDKDDLNKVFDKFKQVGGDILIDKPKGTGLGLPICKEIIEHLGETIWAESEVGVGSRFCFTLSYGYAKTDIDKEEPPVPVFKYRVIDEVAQKVTVKEKDTKPNILIVDDDLNIRKLLRQELEMAGYSVLEAENGAEALVMAKKKYDHIDLILLDIMMPEIDGFDVLSAIKANEKLAHIPVIVISAYEVEKKIYRLGAEGFLSKPIDQGKLISTISSLLNGSAEKKVLIIDSDKNIINALKTSLEGRGYVVSKADNAKDGLKKAQSEKPDIIMLDLGLQDIKSGLEAVKKLRLDKTTSHIYIILLADRMDEKARRIAESLKVEISDPKMYTKNLKSL